MRTLVLGLLAFLIGAVAANAQGAKTKSIIDQFRVSSPIKIGDAPHGMWKLGQSLVIAVSGEDRLARLDLDSFGGAPEFLPSIAVANTPLDARPAPGGGYWVAQFMSTAVVRVNESGKILQSIEAGKSPSLFSNYKGQGKWSIVSEFADQLTLFNAQTGTDIQIVKTGKRPYPASVLADGSVAFIPLRGENAVQVYDLVQGRELAHIGNCAEPEGGDLSADEKWYLAACNDVVLWINTGDYQDTYRTTGLGPRPFAVLTGDGGRFAYVNNAGGDTVSVIDMASKAVIGALVTGQQPIVMREFGGKIYVTNEVAGTLNIITPPTRR
ncbi:MAG: hypothetical protein COA84_00860 [Robiginitomaculum sp.]|nr:MAG: hypothetical protein COA84_00860 [Robiginitomaculum sp.]